MGSTLNIGIIGAGAISGAYLSTFRRLEAVRLVAIADLDQGRARAAALAGRRARVDRRRTARSARHRRRAQPHHPGRARRGRAQGDRRRKGRVRREAARRDSRRRQARSSTQAAAAGVRVGCAPDTVLGTGIQTARKAIDDGLIGTPIAATAVMVTPGHERWHPNPDFYYQPGGGPLLDMGPYYVTALVTMLGPVVSVVGSASHTRQTRTIGSGPARGRGRSGGRGHPRHRRAAARIGRALDAGDELRRRRHARLQHRGARQTRRRWSYPTPTASTAMSVVRPSARTTGRRSNRTPATATPRAVTGSPTSPRRPTASSARAERRPRPARARHHGVAAHRIVDGVDSDAADQLRTTGRRSPLRRSRRRARTRLRPGRSTAGQAGPLCLCAGQRAGASQE